MDILRAYVFSSQTLLKCVFLVPVLICVTRIPNQVIIDVGLKSEHRFVKTLFDLTQETTSQSLHIPVYICKLNRSQNPKGGLWKQSDLVRIRDIRAAVTGISHSVSIPVQLVSVHHLLAVVKEVLQAWRPIKLQSLSL